MLPTDSRVYTAWIEQNQGKHLCICGCAKPIQIKWYHKHNGLPKYIFGHHMHHRKGRLNTNWKGGKYYRGGYVYIYAPHHPRNKKGYMQEHVLVVEATVNRYLNKHEVVHHINGVKDDNRPENLELLDIRSHRQKHSNHDANPAYRKEVSTNDIVRMYQEGVELKEICKTLKCSETLVDLRLKHANIKRNRRNKNVANAKNAS